MVSRAASDADPRLISNLIVDQTLNNPAAIAAALQHAGVTGPDATAALTAIQSQYIIVKALSTQAEIGGPAYAAAKAQLDALLEQHGIEMEGNNVVLPNVAPDEGLSAPFNGWMTFFGQFFDHGLDLIGKGGNGTIYVPLAADDPLRTHGPDGIAASAAFHLRAPSRPMIRSRPLVSGNRILLRLASENYALLQPHLEFVDLPVGTKLQAQGRRIKHVYFLQSGIACVVSGSREQIEIAMVGAEGLIGVAAMLGDASRAPYESRMRMAGNGRRLAVPVLRVPVLREAMNASPALTAALLRYASAFLNQVAQSAIANAVGTVDERTARWLLMADDCTAETRLPVTQEALAAALGVRRSGIAQALADMESKSLIARSHGFVRVVDRKGLQGRANGAYARE
jgi:CRP-like cAMP-binding protein